MFPMAGKINNRRNERVYCGAPARAEGPRGPVRGICRNISVGGLFFLGATFPVGKTIAFTIDLPDLGRVEAQGEIRYVHDYGQEGQGVGVRFTRISQEHLALVSRFVDTHTS